MEVHLIGVANIRNPANSGQISVSSEQLNGDGSVVELIKDSIKYQPVTQSTNLQILNENPPTIQPSTNRVADSITFVFHVVITSALSTHDYFCLQLDNQYQLKY